MKDKGVMKIIVGILIYTVVVVTLLTIGNSGSEDDGRIYSVLNLEMNNLKLQNENLQDTIDAQDEIIKELNEIIEGDMKEIDNTLEELKKSIK